MKQLLFAIAFFVGLFFVACKNQDSAGGKDYSGWPAYAGSKDGIRYSSNTQIDTANVDQLKVAWRFSTGDKDTGNRTQIQCNPIVVDGILYGVSPRLKLFALNATTGGQRWIFDPADEDSSSKSDPYAYYKISRGVMYWQDKEDKRVFYSVGSRTYAINANDGKPVRTFGKHGYIDLAENLDAVGAVGFVSGTTPGIIYKDLMILGARVSESADAAPGHVRAFDVRTGERKWIFHTIPHPGETGYDTWPDKDAYKKLGGANSWPGMALDEAKGIIYVPTGSIGGDFYGGIRKGQNLFGNSLIALDAATGKYLWHYQVIHHDVWDRDLPANPNLLTVKHDGKDIEAVAQITKHGYVFLFDRNTGKPIFPIEEKSFAASDLKGEETWPTQPIPTLPEPFARQQFGPEDVTNIDSETHAAALEKYNKVKGRTLFMPPGKEGVWIFPGFDGGGEWGGSAVDPSSGILYVNSTELPWSLTMIDVPAKKDQPFSMKAMGAEVYSKNCISCHGPERKGNGTAYPSLIGLEKKYNDEQVSQLIANGKNMMPAFKQMNENEKNALLTFILNRRDKEPPAELVASMHKKSILDEVPYAMTGYNRFYDKNGYPGITPPWGTLNAVDLNSGKLLWKVPLGEYPELTKRGMAPTGTENYGGPVVTKGGLIFIAATKDSKIRAFDKRTGKVLWEADLPVPGYATPSVYSLNGKEYIVIACGGGKLGSKSGDEYVAFALPEKQ